MPVSVRAHPVRQDDRADGDFILLHAVHRQTLQVGQGQHGHPRGVLPQGQQLFQAGRVGDQLHLAGALHHFLRLRAGLGGRQAVALDELVELQLQEQLVQGIPVGRLAQGVLWLERNGRVTADACQVVGQFRLLPSLGELFAHRRFQVQVVQLFVDFRNGAVLLDEALGGLLADALHAGDLVGGVPPQTLQVDHFDGLEAVLLLKGRRGHLLHGGLSAAGGDQVHGGVVGDQLKGIPVAGDDDAIPALLLTGTGDGAQQVVRLPAVQLVGGDAHGGQNFLQDRHLHGQLLRHGMALGLVALVGQVAEGGGFPVEGHAEGVRLFVVGELLQNVQEAEEGVGVQPIPSGEQAHPIKGTVDDRVPVQYHQFHPCILAFLRPYPDPLPHTTQVGAGRIGKSSCPVLNRSFGILLGFCVRLRTVRLLAVELLIGLDDALGDGFGVGFFVLVQ